MTIEQLLFVGAGWLTVGVLAFGLGASFGVRRSKARLAEVEERARELWWRVANDGHRVTLTELESLRDVAETGK